MNWSSFYRAYQIGYESDINNNEDLCFGFIDCMVVNDLNKIYFIYKKCNTLGLNNHIKCYHVCMPHEKEENSILRA